MKIAVIAPKVPKNIKELINLDDYLIYACDSAVSDLLNQNIKIDLAIGDFDSLEDLRLLDGIKTIKLNKEKDFSDASYAINHAYNHTDEVVLIGGIKGSRIDHFIANLLLFDTFSNLVIMDETNKLFILKEGEHNIINNGYKYFSVFPVLDSMISIKGAKYNLDDKKLLANDQLGLSNEIINEEAIIKLNYGKLLIVQSK